jgi:hypothetical protein
MVDLLDNFLNLRKLFLAVASNRPATANHVRDEGTGLKQKLLQIERALKNIY